MPTSLSVTTQVRNEGSFGMLLAEIGGVPNAAIKGNLAPTCAGGRVACVVDSWALGTNALS
jgi:hypothetical protein